MENTNQVNQTLLNSLEKRGLLEMTKAYFRTSLLETLKKENLYNTAPMGFKSNPNQIKEYNKSNKASIYINKRFFNSYQNELYSEYF